MVPNAGLQYEKTLTATSEAEYDPVMGVNMKGTFLCCKAAVEAMLMTGGKHRGDRLSAQPGCRTGTVGILRCESGHPEPGQEHCYGLRDKEHSCQLRLSGLHQHAAGRHVQT